METFNFISMLIIIVIIIIIINKKLIVVVRQSTLKVITLVVGTIIYLAQKVLITLLTEESTLDLVV